MPKTLIASLLIAALAGCGDKPSAPEAPPPKSPQQLAMERADMMRQAQAKIEAEKEKLREDMRKAGVGRIKKKKLSGGKDSPKIELEFEFENTGDQELTQAEGAITLLDDKGEVIKQIKVPFRESIKPGKKAVKRGKFPLDPGNDGDQALGKKPLKELNIEWRPRYYRFADGKTLESD